MQFFIAVSNAVILSVLMAEYHNAECCHFIPFSIVMFDVVILSVVMLSVVAPQYYSFNNNKDDDIKVVFCCNGVGGGEGGMQ